MENRVPAEVFPPGDFIKEEIEERGWTQRDLAEILGRAPHTVNGIVLGKTGITPETARGLAAAFGTSPEYWLNLESSYRLHKDPVESADTSVSRRARIWGKAPVRDMIKRGWIENSSNPAVLEQQLLEFFQISNLEEEPAFWPHAARKSTEYEESTPQQTAWLFRCHQLAEATAAKSFTEGSGSQALEHLQALVRDLPNVRRIPAVLADSGIRFVVVEAIPSTKIDGACFWLGREEPVIALSLRLDRIDSFWFTLFHELSHVLAKDGLKERPSVDTDLAAASHDEDRPERERHADSLAAEWLIPQAKLESFIDRVGPLYPRKRVLAFAESAGVHPGIVIGQLQHRGEIPWSHFRNVLVNVRETVIESALTDGWGQVVPITPLRRRN